MSSGWFFASCAARFRLISPHFVHRWTIIYPFRASGSTLIGSICPPHAFALSPGFSSTWRDHRQNGQWFLDVYPSGSTSRPQCAQMNPLSFFVNRFILKPWDSIPYRKTLGLCPKPCLENFWKSFLRTFKTLSKGIFTLMFRLCLFFVAVYALRIPAAPAQNPIERDFVGLRLAPATG